MLQKQILLILAFVSTLYGCYPTRTNLSSRHLYDVTECEFVLDQIYFGLKTPAGEVSEEEWNQFVNGVIAQNFPNGFTVIDARGQWRSNSGEIIIESTKLVQIIYENESESGNKIEKIIEKYKTKFLQESVLRITGCQDVKF